MFVIYRLIIGSMLDFKLTHSRVSMNSFNLPISVGRIYKRQSGEISDTKLSTIRVLSSINIIGLSATVPGAV